MADIVADGAAYVTYQSGYRQLMNPGSRRRNAETPHSWRRGTKARRSPERGGGDIVTEPEDQCAAAESLNDLRALSGKEEVRQTQLNGIENMLEHVTRRYQMRYASVTSDGSRSENVSVDKTRAVDSTRSFRGSMTIMAAKAAIISASPRSADPQDAESNLEISQILPQSDNMGP